MYAFFNWIRIYKKILESSKIAVITYLMSILEGMTQPKHLKNYTKWKME